MKMSLLPDELKFLKEHPYEWEKINNSFSSSESAEIAETLQSINSALEHADESFPG